MKKKTLVAVGVSALVAACSGSVTKSTTPTAPVSPPAAAVVINAPVAVSPADGSTTVAGWPTLVVNNATRSGPAGAITYRFDIATGSDFGTITVTASVSEGAGQTSFTPNVTPLPADQATLYWRAVAIDAQNAVQSAASTTQSFKESNPATKAAAIASQQGVVLWPGAVPPGAPGQATMGNGWGIGNLVSYDGVKFLSPTIDELQVFDCMDRGMQPQAAIDWMHSHGYGTPAAWFPDVAVIGFAHQYIALISGRWDMVLRAGA
jgi:hypothetical protein